MGASVASAGEVVGLIDEVLPVAEIIQRTMAEFFARVRELAARAELLS